MNMININHGNKCDIYEHDKFLSMLINVKMSTLIGILVFMSMIHFMFS